MSPDTAEAKERAEKLLHWRLRGLESGFLGRDSGRGAGRASAVGRGRREGEHVWARSGFVRMYVRCTCWVGPSGLPEPLLVLLVMAKARWMLTLVSKDAKI